jgi:hypothetical protein
MKIAGLIPLLWAVPPLESIEAIENEVREDLVKSGIIEDLEAASDLLFHEVALRESGVSGCVIVFGMKESDSFFCDFQRHEDI